MKVGGGGGGESDLRDIGFIKICKNLRKITHTCSPHNFLVNKVDHLKFFSKSNWTSTNWRVVSNERISAKLGRLIGRIYSKSYFSEAF